MLTIAKQNIRTVRQEDIEEISLLEEASFNDPYPSYFLSELARDNPETFLVLTLNNEIVGYGVVDHWEDHDHLISIAVRPDSRRKGLGEALPVELEKRLSKERPLRLEVQQGAIWLLSISIRRGGSRKPGWQKDTMATEKMRLSWKRDSSKKLWWRIRFPEVDVSYSP